MSIKDDAQKAMALYRNSPEHVKKREQCRLLGVLAKHILNSSEFDDKTPLADLTDEQWRELGFLWSDSRGWLSLSETHPVLISTIGDVFIRRLHYPSIKTLGQLRHLLAAIGGWK